MYVSLPFELGDGSWFVSPENTAYSNALVYAPPFCAVAEGVTSTVSMPRTPAST